MLTDTLECSAAVRCPAELMYKLGLAAEVKCADLVPPYSTPIGAQLCCLQPQC
jgi:hypothetical protein